MLSGALFDFIYRESIIIGVSVIISGACHIGIPFLSSIGGIIALAAIQGFSIGVMDSGGSVCFIRLHGEKVGPWMQAMHFSYAIGTAVCFSTAHATNTFGSHHGCVFKQVAPFVVGAVIDAQGDLVLSFVVLGVATIVAGVVSLFVPSFKLGQKDTTVVSKETVERQSAVPRRWYWGLVGLVAIFLLVYATVEISYGSFLSAYAIAVKAADEVVGSYMTSVYWCTFCAGRLLGVPVATRLRAEIQCGIAVALCFVVVLPLLFVHTRAAVWTVSALYGFVMAPIWASLWSWLGEAITVTGKSAVVAALGCSVGDLGITMLAGNLIAKKGPQSFPVQHVISCCLLIAFYIIVNLCIRRVKRISAAACAVQQKQQEKEEQEKGKDGDITYVEEGGGATIVELSAYAV